MSFPARYVCVCYCVLVRAVGVTVCSLQSVIMPPDVFVTFKCSVPGCTESICTVNFAGCATDCKDGDETTQDFLAVVPNPSEARRQCNTYYNQLQHHIMSDHHNDILVCTSHLPTTCHTTTNPHPQHWLLGHTQRALLAHAPKIFTCHHGNAHSLSYCLKLPIESTTTKCARAA